MCMTRKPKLQTKMKRKKNWETDEKNTKHNRHCRIYEIRLHTQTHTQWANLRYSVAYCNKLNHPVRLQMQSQKYTYGQYGYVKIKYKLDWVWLKRSPHFKVDRNGATYCGISSISLKKWELFGYSWRMSIALNFPAPNGQNIGVYYCYYVNIVFFFVVV